MLSTINHNSFHLAEPKKKAMKETPAIAASKHELVPEKNETNLPETDEKLLNLIAEAIVEILINQTSQTNEGNRIHQDQPERPV